MSNSKSLPVLDEGELYRDHIATVDQDGKRRWIYPKKPSGKYYAARKWVSYLLLVVLFAGPFIRIGGQPLLLLNFLERKFVVFGMAFWPQDFHLFVLAMITFAVAVVLFTAVFGRLWCGWTCPQTIFMEMVFRRIEYWLEGDALSQQRLNAAPWDAEKFIRKLFKHLIFFGIAFLIGNTFMAYIVGSERWLEIVSQPPANNLTGFMAVVIFSGIFYFIFSWFREQACVIVCPYGRFQSVLLDKDSIVVSYDFERGEPRGRLKRGKTQENNGDCIDCHQCVAVCPTGIDIRNGTQLECVNCTACIDACDDIMQKVHKPKGLIRFASYNAIAAGTRKLMTARAYGYSVVLVVLMTIFLTLFINRSATETTVLRTPGSLYQLLDNDVVRNLYSFKIVNKTFDARELEIELVNIDGEITVVGGKLQIQPGELVESALLIDIARRHLSGLTTDITLAIKQGDETLETVKTRFMAPRSSK